MKCVRGEDEPFINRVYLILGSVLLIMVSSTPLYSQPSEVQVFEREGVLSYRGVGNIASSTQAFDINPYTGSVVFAVGVGAFVISPADTYWKIEEVLEARIKTGISRGCCVSFADTNGVVLGTIDGHVLVWPDWHHTDDFFDFVAISKSPDQFIAPVVSVFPISLDTVIVFAENGEASLWAFDQNLKTYKKTETIFGITSNRSIGISADWSPQSERLALALRGSEGLVVVWDRSSGQYAFLNVPPEVEVVALSPDGNLLAYGDAAGNIVLLKVVLQNDALSLEEINRTELRNLNVTALEFSDDGGYLLVAAGMLDSKILLMESPSLRKVLALPAFVGPTYQVAFWPGYHQYVLAVGDEANFLTFLIDSVSKNYEIESKPLFTNDISSISFGATPQHIFVATPLGEIQLWDMNPFKKIGIIEVLEELREEFVTTFDRDFDEKEVVGGTSLGSLIKFRLQNGTYSGRRYKQNFFIQTLRYSKSKRYIGIAGYEGKVLILNAGDLTKAASFDLGDAAVLSIDFGGSDQWVILGTEDSCVYKIENMFSPERKITRHKLDGRVTAVAVSPDDRAIFVGTDGGKLYFLKQNADKEDELILTEEFLEPVTSLKFSEDGLWLLVATVHKLKAYRVNATITPEYALPQTVLLQPTDSLRFPTPIRGMDLSGSKLVVGAYPGVVYTIEVSYPEAAPYEAQLPEQKSPEFADFHEVEITDTESSHPINVDKVDHTEPVVPQDTASSNIARVRDTSKVITNNTPKRIDDIVVTTSSSGYPKQPVDSYSDLNFRSVPPLGIEIISPEISGGIIRIPPDGTLWLEGYVSAQNSVLDFWIKVQPVGGHNESPFTLIRPDSLVPKGEFEGKQVFYFKLSVPNLDEDGLYIITLKVKDFPRFIFERKFIVQKGELDKLFVVIIGVDRSYRDGGIIPTDYAIDAAREFYQTLINTLNIPIENIVLLIGTEATSEQIEAEIRRIAIKAQNAYNSSVLFVYFGQAFYEPTYNDDIYFLTSDTRMSNLSSTSLSLRTVMKLLTPLSFPPNICMIVDAVNPTAVENVKSFYKNISLDKSDIALSLNRLLSTVPLEYGHRRIRLLVSTAGQSVSIISSDGKTTLFAERTMKGLKGEADIDSNGVVMFSELEKFLLNSINSSSHGKQQVFKGGSLLWDFPLSTSSITIGNSVFGESK